MRLKRIGSTAYAAYRTGSGVVHGSFADIYEHHLDDISGGFEIELRPQRIRPQPLLSVALLPLLTLGDYSRIFLGRLLPDVFQERGGALIAPLQRLMNSISGISMSGEEAAVRTKELRHD